MSKAAMARGASIYVSRSPHPFSSASNGRSFRQRRQAALLVGPSVRVLPGSGTHGPVLQVVRARLCRGAARAHPEPVPRPLHRHPGHQPRAELFDDHLDDRGPGGCWWAHDRGCDSDRNGCQHRHLGDEHLGFARPRHPARGIPAGIRRRHPSRLLQLDGGAHPHAHRTDDPLPGTHRRLSRVGAGGRRRNSPTEPPQGDRPSRGRSRHRAYRQLRRADFDSRNAPYHPLFEALGSTF